MSLILEALKKVERERATPEQRGFLVLGPAAWAPSRSNLAWVLGMVAAAAVAGGTVYVLTRSPTSAGAARPAERSAPAAAPAPIADRAPVPAADTAWQPPPAVKPVPPRAAASGVPPAEPVLQLNAISAQDGLPVAVVNDRVVREGDSFDGVRVLRIGAAEVEVEVRGARRILRF